MHIGIQQKKSVATIAVSLRCIRALSFSLRSWFEDRTDDPDVLAFLRKFRGIQYHISSHNIYLITVCNKIAFKFLSLTQHYSRDKFKFFTNTFFCITIVSPSTRNIFEIPCQLAIINIENAGSKIIVFLPVQQNVSDHHECKGEEI